MLLVLDVSGQSQTAAAVARGFTLHDPAVRIGGVVLNRVGSERHRDGIARAMGALPLPVLGSVPREAAVALPERHLGLVQAGEQSGRLPDLITRLADLAERYLDLDAILALASPLSPTSATGASFLPPPGQRVALAQDDAFSFIYPHLVAAWREAGTEIVPFSPLADEPPPEDCELLLAAGRLPRAARWPPRRRRPVSRRQRTVRRDAADPRRVRRPHGARRRA